MTNQHHALVNIITMSLQLFVPKIHQLLDAEYFIFCSIPKRCIISAFEGPALLRNQYAKLQIITLIYDFFILYNNNSTLLKKKKIQAEKLTASYQRVGVLCCERHYQHNSQQFAENSNKLIQTSFKITMEKQTHWNK